jgi:molybdenum cofactor biosynthesis enzyme MoaA
MTTTRASVQQPVDLDCGGSALDKPDVRPTVPTYVHTDRTLRVKIIDGCGMTCTFCHNEGTPVVADNVRAESDYVSGGRSGRVSIYLATNGARFLPATVVPDAEFGSTLALLCDALRLNELHLTGGEPTLHPRLVEIVRVGVRAGLGVCVTSNGERGAAVLEDCARAGLGRVNFSIFGTTPAELAQVQHSRFADVRRAERKIAALKESVGAAERAGIRASANIVVPSGEHAARVLRLLEEYSPCLSVRLLNSLDGGAESIAAIYQILADLGGVAIAHHVTAGVSGSRTAYELPGGRTIWFKQIRSVRLPETCAGCRFNNDTDCQEGFYGVRLYRDARGGYQVGVCIQRMDLCMPVEEFVRHDLCREVVALRDAEYRQLSEDRSW